MNTVTMIALLCSVFTGSKAVKCRRDLYACTNQESYMVYDQHIVPYAKPIQVKYRMIRVQDFAIEKCARKKGLL